MPPERRPAPITLRRSLLAAIAVIAIASLVAIGFVVRGRQTSDTSSSTAASIRAEFAKLVIKPRTVELTVEKSMQVRQAIKTGDYQTAEQITGAVLGASHLQNWVFYPFDRFIHAVSDLDDSAYGAQLTNWVTLTTGDDPIPLLLRARYYYDLGWRTRGNGFAADTPSAHMSSFADDMKNALVDVNAVIRLNPKNPYPFLLRVFILRGFGVSKELTAAFDEAVARFPDYYQLYDTYLETLQPRWGGTIDAMYALVNRYADAAAADSPLKLLYVELYFHLLSTASLQCGGLGHDTAKVPRCVAATMTNMVKPSLEHQVVTALALYDHTDKYQFGVAVGDILTNILEVTGGDVYSGAMLQLAATAMHTDTQLMEDNPSSHNNYIIDRLVAKSWLQKKFYENALKKYIEALKDSGTFAFPNEEERLLAVSAIYDETAGVYGNFGQYAQMIAFEKAAVAYGGNPIGEVRICYGYHKLKDYADAIAACTVRINKTNEVRAYYWRGVARRDVGDADAAIKDLTTVSESDSAMREYSGIDLSMIYFGRKDNEHALDVLNRYTYLYNPNLVSDNTVAVAYNNRCYAYKQLGQLQNALDDCTRSLKYGSLPDAYRKQQELVKQLGGH